MNTLRQFVEHASGTVEKVFRRVGVIKPMFHVVKRDGAEFVLPGDIGRDKDMTCVLARAAFEVVDAVRYLFVDEAWTVEALGDNAEEIVREAIRVGVSNHPARKEVIMFSAEDEREGQMLARRVIIRPATGHAYLGPLVIETDNISEGRFVGLLPRKTAVH
jgi:hypothetical protein